MDGWNENGLRELTRDPKDKVAFRAKRYMDDILMFYTKHPSWDHERFLRDFSDSQCYWQPLKLETANPDTFLETKFSCSNHHLTYRIKNLNEIEDNYI